MVIHWLIDLFKSIRGVSKGPQVRRMTLNEVWQHTFLMVTFHCTCHHRLLAALLRVLVDEFPLQLRRRLRTARHHPPCRRRPLLPDRLSGTCLSRDAARPACSSRTSGRGKIDFIQFFQMVGYNLGCNKVRPKFDRFSYVEKAEYWALVWGSVVMIVTGFSLWFDNVMVHWFPKGFLDVVPCCPLLRSLAGDPGHLDLAHVLDDFQPARLSYESVVVHRQNAGRDAPPRAPAGSGVASGFNEGGKTERPGTDFGTTQGNDHEEEVSADSLWSYSPARGTAPCDWRWRRRLRLGADCRRLSDVP